jgi:hypothetical protein
VIRQRSDALEQIVEVASPTVIDQLADCSARLTRCAELARRGLEPIVEDDS